MPGVWFNGVGQRCLKLTATSSSSPTRRGISTTWQHGGRAPSHRRCNRQTMLHQREPPLRVSSEW